MSRLEGVMIWLLTVAMCCLSVASYRVADQEIARLRREIELNDDRILRLKMRVAEQRDELSCYRQKQDLITAASRAGWSQAHVLLRTGALEYPCTTGEKQ